MAAPKNLITKLTLREVSLVDDPDNAEATVEIVKGRGAEQIAAVLDKMRTFADGFAARRRWGDANEIASKARDAVDALQSSVMSIFDDGAITDKRTAIAGEVAQAKAAMNEILGTYAVLKSAGGDDADDDAGSALAHAFRETIMDIEKIQASLEAAEEAVTKSNAKVEEVTAEMTKLKDQLAAKDAEIAKLKAGPKEGADDGEDIFKGMSAAAKEAFIKLQKSADANAAALARLEMEKQASESITKARTDGLPSPEKTGPLLIRIEKGQTTADDVKLVTELLKGAGEKMRASPILKVVGSRGAEDAGSAEAELNAKADEIQKASGGKLTFQQAYGQAIEQNAALYDRYTIEKRRKALAVGDDGE